MKGTASVLAIVLTGSLWAVQLQLFDSVLGQVKQIDSYMMHVLKNQAGLDINY